MMRKARHTQKKFLTAARKKIEHRERAKRSGKREMQEKKRALKLRITPKEINV